MAETDLKTRFETLLHGAVLDVAVLKTPDVNLQDLLADGSLDKLRNAPMRKNLFFDEHANVSIVLKATAGENELKTLLPNVEIVLAAHATDALPQGTGNVASASGYHDLVSEAIAGATFQSIITANNVSFVVWKAILHLVRPRARLQRPAIYFTANLTLAAQPSNTAPESEEALRPFEPLPANVLAPLNRAPEFEGKKIHLSADRITKVAPKAPKKLDTVKPIRGTSKQAFPTLPAMFARIKSSRLPDGIVASLHLEAAQNVAGSFVVDDLRLIVPDPKAKYKAVAAADQAEREGRDAATTATDFEQKALQPMIQPNMPLRMSSGDETILLYQIEANMTKLNVSVKATLSLDQGTSVRLGMTSEASDRSVPLQESTETKYHWSRLAASEGSHQAHNSLTSGQKPPDNKEKKTAGHGGINLFFTAPATTHKGDEFVLKVKCVNNTDRPRHVTIVPVHHRSAEGTRPQRPTADANGKPDVVAGILSAPALRSMANTQSQFNVMCLTPDVRIGPLPPGVTSDAQVVFRATFAGVLNLKPLRIIDLETKQTVDVWDLPDVVALEVDPETARKPARVGKMSSGVKPVEDDRFVAWRQAEEERIRREIGMQEGKVEA